MATTFDPTALDEADLRAALAEARQRLPHEETCEHCARSAEENLAAARSHRRAFAEFNDHASEAGYVLGQKNALVHRWDCPHIQTYLRGVLDRLDAAGEQAVANDIAHGYSEGLPAVLTAEAARAFLARGGPRRTCRACSPDL